MKARTVLVAAALGLAGGLLCDLTLFVIAVGDPGGWAPWRVACAGSPLVLAGLALGFAVGWDKAT